MKIHIIANMNEKPRIIPTSGEITIKEIVLIHPEATNNPEAPPCDASAAPAYPPTSACDELDGRP